MSGWGGLGGDNPQPWTRWGSPGTSPPPFVFVDDFYRNVASGWGTASGGCPGLADWSATILNQEGNGQPVCPGPYDGPLTSIDDSVTLGAATIQIGLPLQECPDSAQGELRQELGCFAGDVNEYRATIPVTVAPIAGPFADLFIGSTTTIVVGDIASGQKIILLFRIGWDTDGSDDARLAYTDWDGYLSYDQEHLPNFDPSGSIIFDRSLSRGTSKLWLPWIGAWAEDVTLDDGGSSTMAIQIVHRLEMQKAPFTTPAAYSGSSRLTVGGITLEQPS